MTRHIQNPAIGHYSAIFGHCATLLVQRLHTQKPGIFDILEYFKTILLLHPEVYSELCHIYENLRIFRTLTYLKPDTYSEPSQRFTMKFFYKNN